MGLSRNKFHRIVWMRLTFVKGPVVVLSPSSGPRPGRVLSGPQLQPPRGSPCFLWVTSAPPAITAILLKLKSGGVTPPAQTPPSRGTEAKQTRPAQLSSEPLGGRASPGDKGHCGSGSAWSCGLRALQMGSPNVYILQMRT